MFTLTLLRFTPISKESHLVAVIVAFLGYLVDAFAMPTSTTITSFSTALVAAICWYVYKVFDGVTYDGAETAYASMLGIAVSIGICSTYFLI